MTDRHEKEGIDTLENFTKNILQNDIDQQDVMPSVMAVKYRTKPDQVTENTESNSKDIIDDDVITPITSEKEDTVQEELLSENNNINEIKLERKQITLKQKIIFSVLICVALTYSVLNNFTLNKPHENTIASVEESSKKIATQKQTNNNKTDNYPTHNMEDSLSVSENTLIDESNVPDTSNLSTLPEIGNSAVYIDNINPFSKPKIETQKKLEIISSVPKAVMPNPTQAFGTIALSLLTKKVDGQYDALNNKVKDASSKNNQQDASINGIATKLDNIERIQIDMITKKKAYSKPIIKNLLIAKPTYCENCVSMASFSHKGKMVTISDNDTFLDFNAVIQGDRLILKNEDVQYSFFARP